MQSLDMTSVSLSDTFAIKGTQETITITISRQEEQDNSVLKTQTPSRRNSNTSNSSSRSSTFNIHYIPFLGEDDMTSSGYSDPGISDNDLSPGASFHGSQEDLFTKSDTEDDFIEKDISNSQPTSFRSKKSFNNDGSSSPRTSPRTRSKWETVRQLVHWSPFVQVYKKQYPWVQLAGHQGSFRSGGGNGTVLKKCSKSEASALKALMSDCMKPYVPEFRRELETDGERYLEMQDLLRDFDNPNVMDIKMGIRTYLEEEITKGKDKLRKDMYQKMIEVDPNEPTAEEHLQLAITKPRYMQWRESISSSSTLGFRIEGIKSTDGKLNKDFKLTRTEEQVFTALRKFIDKDSHIVKAKFLTCLQSIYDTVEKSDFFKTHEVIGSSLLFVYDSNEQAGVWVIDFGKTVELPPGISVTHQLPWTLGNHEDGYLWGLENLISLWKKL
ncbi:inositol-trisphosphate 3-kinase B-like isoform X2 [Dysidea avara]